MDNDFHGCKVALFIGERLLVILRDDFAHIPYPNCWDFPGGARDDLETPMQTLAREVMEEVGLVIPDEAFVWKKRYPGNVVPNEMVWFYVAQMPASTENDIVFGNEGQRWALMSVAEFEAQPNIVTPFAQRVADWQSTQ